MLDVEDWRSLRWLHLREGKSQRWISKEFGISRNTVSKYLQNPDPPKYTMKTDREQPLRAQWRPIVARLLEADSDAPKKQRHTARRLYDRLVAEHGYRGSIRTVQYLMTEFRKTGGKQVSLPLAFQAGKDAQVDFSESVVILAGQKQKVFGFEMRLNYSRKKFVMFFPCQNREAFYEGHVQAFEYFGGVPARITYDNLRAAVRKVLQGKRRELADGFKKLAGYYAFEPNFCTPRRANEKGGIEGSIGYSRRNWLVPVPSFSDMDELNRFARRKCDEENNRVVAGTSCTIGEAFDCERGHLLGLPGKPFGASIIQAGCVDGYSTISFARNHYSVPVSVADKRLLVRAYWDRIEITDGRNIVAQHKRCHSVGKYIFDPFHYIEALEKKPNAVPYAAPIVQHEWPPGYWQFFERLNKIDSSRAGREFVRLLRIHRQYGPTLTIAAVEEANGLLATNCDVVLSFIHCKMREQQVPPQLELIEGELATHAVKLAQPDQYDELLGGHEHDKQCIA